MLGLGNSIRTRGAGKDITHMQKGSTYQLLDLSPLEYRESDAVHRVGGGCVL